MLSWLLLLGGGVGLALLPLPAGAVPRVVVLGTLEGATEGGTESLPQDGVVLSQGLHFSHGSDAGTGGLLCLRHPGVHNFGELVLAPLVGDGAFLSGDSGDPLNVPGGEETLESGMSMKRY